MPELVFAGVFAGGLAALDLVAWGVVTVYRFFIGAAS